MTLRHAQGHGERNRTMTKKGMVRPAHHKFFTATAHKVPTDLQKALTSSGVARAAWEDITPLARNEWICWILSAKYAETRSRRTLRTRKELIDGKRRPCCWVGCAHR